MSSKLQPEPRLYFAYGSNLSLTQMASRCPSSTYYALGLLRNYKWIINARGYANVVATPFASTSTEEHIVYGLLYTLTPTDEATLDIAEGVPYAYTKHLLPIEIITPNESRDPQTKKDIKVVNALVYVDEKRVYDGVCKEEYVARINRGVKDAVGKGMDEGWVENYIRVFVPERTVEGEDMVRDPFLPSKRRGE